MSRLERSCEDLVGQSANAAACGKDRSLIWMGAGDGGSIPFVHSIPARRTRRQAVFFGNRIMRVPLTRSCHASRSLSNPAHQNPNPPSSSDSVATA